MLGETLPDFHPVSFGPSRIHDSPKVIVEVFNRFQGSKVGFGRGKRIAVCGGCVERAPYPRDRSGRHKEPMLPIPGFPQRRKFGFLGSHLFVFSKQGPPTYSLDEFRKEIRVRTSGFECLNVHLVRYNIWGGVAREFQRICITSVAFYLEFRVRFGVQTKRIT